MIKHARLSASGANKWINCPPSIVLEEQCGPEQPSLYAEEGTLAHRIAEVELKFAFGRMSTKDYEREMQEIRQHELYSLEMLDYIDDYMSSIIARAASQEDLGLIRFEERVDFGEWVKDGFGTVDVLTIYGDTLEVIDLKYGAGVPVSVHRNPQLMLYALGAYSMYSMIYSIKNVRLTICQPRLSAGFSSYDINIDELLDWAENVVRPAAELAHAGEGDQKAGEHCTFCRAKARCRKRAELSLEIAKYEFRPPGLLTDDEIAEILGQAKQISAWVSDVKDYALEQVANHGKKFKGWKLVEGRSNRMYKDVIEAAKRLKEAGWEDAVIYTKNLLGITAMEKLIGKKAFDEILSDLVTKPKGKPTLVPESDKRPEINSLESAIIDFQ